MTKLQENKLREYIRNIIRQEIIIPKQSDETEYQKFFKAALKKLGVSSPDELTPKRKEAFFNWVDANWDAGENETDLDETTSVTAQAGGDSYNTPFAFSKKGLDPKKKRATKAMDWEVKDTLEEGKKIVLDYHKFLATIDATTQSIVEDLFKSANYPYIDTPGNYQNEKKQYRDIVDFMKSNMGLSDYSKLRDFYNKNKKLCDDFTKRYGKQEMFESNQTNNKIKYAVKVRYSKEIGPNKNGKDYGYLLIGNLGNQIGYGEWFNTPKERDNYLKKQQITIKEEVFNTQELTPKQKIHNSVKAMKESLELVEKFIDESATLKEQERLGSNLYKRTFRALGKISEQIVRIQNKIQRIK